MCVKEERSTKHRESLLSLGSGPGKFSHSFATITTSIENSKLWAKSNIAMRKWKNNSKTSASSNSLNIL